MKVKCIILLISLVMVLSCNDTDDTIPQDPLEGSWHLKTVSGGIQGIDLDYDRNDVIWNFTMNQNTLIVETNFLTTGPKSVYQGLISGSYAVGLEEDDSRRTLLIESFKFRILEVDQTKTLVLDDGVAADGFIRSFVR